MQEKPWALIGGGIVLAAGVIGWLWLRPVAFAEARAPVAAANHRTAAPALQALPAVIESTVPMPAPQDPADKAWCQLPVAEPVPNEQGVIGLVEINAAAEASPSARQFEAASRQLRQDWARWLAPGDDASRALGQYLQEDDDPAARGRLVAMARVTRDPAVYALAYLSCGRATADCQGLSARQWAALEPDNLQPWLYEVGEAQARGDGQAVQEAVHRMGLATRSELPVPRLMNRLQALPRSGHEGLRQSVEAMEPYRWLFRDGLPSFAPLMRYCKAAVAAQDVNRAASCGEAADALWNHGGDLMQRTLAIALGVASAQARETWAARKLSLALHRRQFADLHQRQIDALAAVAMPTACTGAAWQVGYLTRLLAMGEWGVAQQEVDRLSPTERAAAEQAVRAAP